MVFWAIYILCSATMMWLDYRIAALIKGEGRERNYLYLTVAWIFDTIPFWWWAISLLWHDNATWMTMASMWLSFIYMIEVIARGPFALAMVFGKRWWRMLGLAVSLTIIAVFLYGMAVTRTDYQVRNIRIESSRLPESFSGYRIVQFSDLHIGSMVNPEREVADIVSIVNAQQADAIIFSGDLIEIRHSELTPQIISTLRQLKARDGIFSVIGNHDRGVYVRDSITLTPAMTTAQVITAERTMGWRVLDDEMAYVHRGEDSIAVTGISFSEVLQEKRHSSNLPDFDIKHAYSEANSNTFNITISHIPQLWDRIVELGMADITLSGHIHAMQIKLPIGQRGISPSQLIHKWWSGLYEERGHWLYVNDGIGCAMWPMRLGVRPEITVIELVPTT